MTDLGALFAEAGVTGALHARDLATGREVGHRPDEPQVLASVFKVPVLLELCLQHADGRLDATAPVAVPVAGRAPGPFGLSLMRDPATLSLRDLAWLMMGVSDNAATDVVCEHVGLAAVSATLDRLGLTATRVAGDCRELFRTVMDDLGVDALDDVDLTSPRVREVRAVDPARTLHASTPRDMTALLQLVWTDEAGDPAACAEVRRVLGLQVWPHRLASGFGDDDRVRTSGKTGTLAMVRNEVGVVEHPDGGRYAVAVFTRSRSLRLKQPAADAVIGAAARWAVDRLRAQA